MYSAFLKFAIGVLMLLAALYGAGIALVAFQGFFPSYCKGICHALELRVPKEPFDVLLVVGMNIGLLGGIWWGIAWAAGALVSCGAARMSVQGLQRFANRAGWVSMTMAGVMLLLPLLMIALRIAIAIIAGVLVLFAAIYRYLI